MPSPSVSVITANLNGARHLASLLPSLTAQHHSVEIVVVDNGSTDDSEAIVRDAGAMWHAMGENVGLARALAAGADVALGDLLLFVNNDMRFPNDFVERLVAARQQSPDCFAVDAVQFDWEGTEVVHSLARLRRTFSLRTDVPGWRIDTACEPRAELEPTVYASAANFLVSRSDLLAVGGWDTGFFLGHEDVDLCWRAWLQGRPVVLAHRAIAFHDVSATSRSPAGVTARSYGSLSGRLRFATKHLPVEHVLLNLLTAFVGLLSALIRGGFAVRLRAIRDYALDLPDILRVRRKIYADAKTTPRRHLARMKRIGSA